MRNKIIVFFFFNLFVISITQAFSEETSVQLESTEPTQSIQEEIRWLQAEAMVAITTKHEIPISKAPGIVTVITANQIKQMGLRTLTMS